MRNRDRLVEDAFSQLEKDAIRERLERDTPTREKSAPTP